MEIFGDIATLKKTIEDKYASKIKDVEKEKGKQLIEIEGELNKKIELLRSHMKTLIDMEVKKAYSMLLSLETLKAKKEFEEKREALIESVFKEAEKRAKEVTHTKDYFDFINRNIPKEEKLSAMGDSDYYKKLFPKLKVDKNIIGLKLESEGAVYDFTLNNLITSKRDILRYEVSKLLFS